MNTELFEGK